MPFQFSLNAGQQELRKSFIVPSSYLATYIFVDILFIKTERFDSDSEKNLCWRAAFRSVC